MKKQNSETAQEKHSGQATPDGAQDKEAATKQKDAGENSTDKTSKSATDKANTSQKVDDKGAAKSAGAAVKKSAAKRPPAKKKTGSGAALGIGILAVLLSLGAGYGVYYLYQQDKLHKASLADDLAALQSRISANQQGLTRLTELDGLKQEIAAVRSEVGNVTSTSQRIEAEQQALNVALADMSAKLGRTTVAWRLAEIEYLLITANTRLRLERDRNTALVALQTADEKLRAIGDPTFVPVRQTIALEITQLKAVPDVDITGMALTLGSLARAVDDLPLIDTQPVRTAGPAINSSQEDYKSLDWGDIPAAIWDDIRGLVVVRRVDKPVEPLLPPAEEWYLRQNLQLKLEQARLSLLRHETTLFHHQLDEAGEWLSAYFDGDNSKVSSLLSQLQELKKTELQPPMPDISDSLRVLREHMKRLGEEVEAAQREGGEQ